MPEARLELAQGFNSPTDFKSGASADSATRAHFIISCTNRCYDFFCYNLILKKPLPVTILCLFWNFYIPKHYLKRPQLLLDARDASGCSTS